ncbi:MAG: family 20 glycosylhydrolase [Segetibacter sp.]
MKEIIQYAADRFVTVLPEIDVPGHSLAAIASYPELSMHTRQLPG